MRERLRLHHDVFVFLNEHLDRLWQGAKAVAFDIGLTRAEIVEALYCTVRVNLDDWETHDPRQLLPGLAVTVEPGVYLGHIGIRSEVNVLITQSGATVTTPVQQEPYRLGD